MPKRTVLSRTPVRSYIPKESEIQHVVYEDGEEAYHTRPMGPYGYNYKLNVVATELEDLVSNWIDQLISMVRLLEDDDYSDFGHNFKTLLHAFDRNMDEVLHAVYEDIGQIKIREVTYNVSNWRQSRVVGTEFEPADHGDKGLQPGPKG